MIPAEFDYVRAGSVDEALGALRDSGDDAKVLAGGQSLIPLLRLRLAYPSVLVDVGRIDEMRGVREDGDRLVIGAATTHDEVLRDPLVRTHCPVITEVTETVADPAVRHRGTFGGSIAHAEPAGDLPALALALDASMEVAGSAGRRTIPAGEFFVDFLQTAVGPDEVLVSVSVPKLGDGWGHRYEKFNLVAQSWAVVGALAVVQRSNGDVGDARVGLVNMGPTPIRARAVERALVGSAATAESVAAAAASASDGTSPSSDIHASADYRTHLAQVLTGRALTAAAGI
ncbi:MAG TPA: xanthine dehydrogenase family protein subunit M [Jiangellaceae bacterium]|nr:xanthine dehydrogenase family protein subunit M [Jiangellaceae bacterium]